jgi:micrococcal nuclease
LPAPSFVPIGDGVNLSDMDEGAPNVSGYDAAEVRNALCQDELELGRAATARMAELLETEGLQIIHSGQRDRYGRPLVSALLSEARRLAVF